jgi:hypothetical protein
VQCWHDRSVSATATRRRFLLPSAPGYTTVTMTDDRRTESGKTAARERREARLAAALRLNLKRRKVAAKGETGTREPPATDPKPAPPDRR